MQLRETMTAVAVAFVTLACPKFAHGQATFEAVHGVDGDRLSQWVQELDRKGLRLDYVSGSQVGDRVEFAAIAVANSGKSAWAARHGLTNEQFQQQFREWTEKGYRLKSVSGYRNGDAVNYAGVWTKDGFDGAWQARHGLTSQQYQQAFNEVTQKGMRPLQVVGYPAGDIHLLAAIFVEDGVREWAARHDMTDEQYQDMFNVWSKKGHTPVSVSVYGTGQGTRFAAVFAKVANDGWQARHHLTGEQYQNLFNDLTRKGYRPTQVCSYSREGGVRYAAVFVRPTPPPMDAQPLPMSGLRVPKFDSFDGAMQKFMQARSIPGGTLAVSKNGKLLLSRGYGWADRERKLLLGPDVPLRLASISKPITLAAIFKLVREGKLDLDDRVVRLLGLKPLADQKVDPRWESITVRHLVQHRGGWDRTAAFDPMFQPVKIAAALSRPAPATSMDVIQYMVGQPLQFEPGAKFEYSNFGYCLLGRVIEKVSGKKYVDFVREEITWPLGMKTVELGRSLPDDRNPREPAYLDARKGPNLFKRGEVAEAPDGTFHLEAMDAHGGLICSSPDLVKFLDAYWMNGQPRKEGAAAHAFFGSLPGTWTVAIQREDGFNIAALFNQRSDPSGLPYEDIRTMLNKAADEVGRKL